MTRPSLDEWGILLAKLVSTRATCMRRAVGCVLVDENGAVLATGYNGVASQMPHCNEGHPCLGAASPSGTNLDACQAIHAEQNALLQCADVNAIDTAYVTCTPCITCTKLLMNTECSRIIAAEKYAHDDEARKLWEDSGGEWLIKPAGNEYLLRICGHQSLMDSSHDRQKSDEERSKEEETRDRE